MKNKSKPAFKVGEAVVYNAPDGSSLSAKISHVASDCVYIEWYPRYAQKHTLMVERPNWGRLVKFGAGNFTVL